MNELLAGGPVALGIDRLPAPFLLALGLTVVGLLGVVWTGATRRRRAHYTAIVAMFAALTWAIREAERLGRDLVFDGAAGTVKDVHMVAVGVTFVLVPALAFTGVRLARGRPGARPAHRRLAVAFVAAVLVTCALGTTMTLLAAPREAAPPSEAAAPGATGASPAAASPEDGGPDAPGGSR